MKLASGPLNATHSDKTVEADDPPLEAHEWAMLRPSAWESLLVGGLAGAVAAVAAGFFIRQLMAGASQTWTIAAATVIGVVIGGSVACVPFWSTRYQIGRNARSELRGIEEALERRAKMYEKRIADYCAMKERRPSGFVGKQASKTLRTRTRRMLAIRSLQSVALIKADDHGLSAARLERLRRHGFSSIGDFAAALSEQPVELLPSEVIITGLVSGIAEQGSDPLVLESLIAGEGPFMPEWGELRELVDQEIKRAEQDVSEEEIDDSMCDVAALQDWYRFQLIRRQSLWFAIRAIVRHEARNTIRSLIAPKRATAGANDR